MKLAVIDIGSNSVRLMSWADGKVLYKQLQTTRLGEGLSGGVLLPEAIERTARAVCAFHAQSILEGADEVYAFATAAVRSAKNGEEFCGRVKELCGLTVDVVSGQDEARLGLSGALASAQEGSIIDIGGGSTEVCVRMHGKTSYAKSIDLGAVRLFDGCGQEKEKLLAVIRPAIEAFSDCRLAGRVYAVGGTATTLAAVALGLERYDAAKVQDYRMTAREVGNLAEQLLSLSLQERILLAGMDARRAEIIGGGALLLHEIMKKLSIDELYVSDSDNQEGYLYGRILG